MDICICIYIYDIMFHLIFQVCVNDHFKNSRLRIKYRLRRVDDRNRQQESSSFPIGKPWVCHPQRGISGDVHLGNLGFNFI